MSGEWLGLARPALRNPAILFLRNMELELISKLSIDIQSLLTQELKCYQRLIELSERQQFFIRLGDIDALMSVLAQKEDLISKISQLQSAIQHIFLKSPKLRQQMPGSVNHLIKIITAIQKKLTVKESESETMFIERYNAVKKELLNLKQTRTILKTYVPQRTYRPRFIDKET